MALSFGRAGLRVVYALVAANIAKSKSLRYLMPHLWNQRKDEPTPVLDIHKSLIRYLMTTTYMEIAHVYHAGIREALLLKAVDQNQR